MHHSIPQSHLLPPLMMPRSSKTDSQLGLASLPIDQIRIGAALSSPIFDDESEPPKLLLAAGTVLTEGLLVQLQNRSLTTIRVARQELVHLKKISEPESETFSFDESDLDATIQEEENEEIEAASESDSSSEPEKESENLFPTPKPGSPWGIKKDSFIHQVEKFTTENYDPVLISQFKKEFSKNLRQSQQLFFDITNNNVKNSDSSSEITQNTMERMKNDTDLFLSINLTSSQYQGPWKHGLQTSMLAMSIGTYLGLSESDINELALGCLLHEVGTLKLNPKYSYVGHQLDTLEQLELTKHPGITMDTIRKWPDMPGTSCLIAYQIHERCDGSGYPNGRNSSQLHYLSKIAAVADAFITLITDYKSLKSLLPYHALEQILHQTQRGKFDPEVVRGLLHAVSLFPVGSLVELSDNRVGRILRSNDSSYINPICELWFREDPAHTKTIVDLSQESDIHILRPLKELPAAPAIENSPSKELDSTQGQTNSEDHEGNPEASYIEEEDSSVLDKIKI